MNATTTLHTNTKPKGIARSYKGKPLIHCWPYGDAQGKVYGYAARYGASSDDKDVVPYFRQGETGWKSGAPPEPRPLYGLDSLNGRERDFVIVVEGEKCAAALHSLGLPCVTSLGGAQSPHKSDWTPVQQFRRVYLLPDNDEAGEGYMRAVTGIVDGLPTSPERLVARFPDLPKHGDVVDWVQAHITELWDTYAPAPREPGDHLDGELTEAIEKHAVPVPAEWTALEATSAEPDTATDGWEAPVSLELAIIPLWPRDVFPEPVQMFVNALQESTETPPELPALMVLPVLATAAQGKYRVLIKEDYCQPLNLWTCCALPSGSRKTAVQMAATAPLVQWERARREELQPEIQRAELEAKTWQGRIDALQKKVAKAKSRDEADGYMQEILELENDLPEVPSLPQVWADDVTPENLAMIMAANQERMAVLSDEGGIFDILAGRYSAKRMTNLDVFLKAHEGSDVRVNRVNRPPISLRQPCLTVGIAPQCDVVRTLSDKPDFRGRGLLARFLYAMPKPTLGRRTNETSPMPDSVKNTYHRTVQAMLEHPWNKNAQGEPCAHVLTLSDDAFRAWQRFWTTNEAGMGEGATFSHITDWGAKFPAAVARIAAVFHVTRHAHEKPWEHPISAVDIEAALRLVEPLKQHALLAFDCMGADAALEGARALHAWIRRKGLTVFKHRDAFAENRSTFRQSSQLDGPLRELAERHYIRKRPQPTSRSSGRPSAIYGVNPAALKGG